MRTFVCSRGFMCGPGGITAKLTRDVSYRLALKGGFTLTHDIAVPEHHSGFDLTFTLTSLYIFRGQS